MRHRHTVRQQTSAEMSQILPDLNIHYHPGHNGQRSQRELPCKKKKTTYIGIPPNPQ